MAIDTNNFFKSKDVRAFPCSYRGNYGGSTFDPESRLNTEYNFTHLGGANESYVIDYNAAEQILRLVIGGYYFEISNAAAYDLSGKYLSIGTKTVSVKESDGTDSDRTTRVLASRSGTNADLDEQQGGEYYFTGIFIGNEPAGEAYLKAFSNYPEIYQPSLRPAIKRGEGAKSTLLGDAGEASGNSSHAEGTHTAAIGKSSHAEGNGTIAYGEGSHAAGNATIAVGNYSHAEGLGRITNNAVTFGERVGESTKPYTYKYAKALGVSVGSVLKVNIDNTDYYLRVKDIDTINTQISFESLTSDFPAGTLPNAMLVKGIASGNYSHAEGINTTASEYNSHAEGINTTASGPNSHAEGYYTTASGSWSHAEGGGTTASGNWSHAEGRNTKASGDGAHAGGSNTIASRDNQTAIGEYNKEEDGEFIVGVGTGEEDRNNALVVNGLKTTVKNTFAVIGDAAATFFTGPDKTEITTKTNSISGDTNSIKGAANAITGATAIVAEDKDKESKETKIAVDDNEITLQDTDDSYIKVNRGGANRNTKQVEISSTNINSAASSANSISGKEIIIGGTGADSVISAKIGSAEKITVNASSTTVSNGAVSINGDANKIEVTADGTKITSGTTTITNGNDGKGIEIKVSGQGTQINVDGNDLFSKWIKEYVLDAAYPVGSIYTSTELKDGKCPIEATLGGTWTQIKGRFLAAAGQDEDSGLNLNAGNKGGSKDAVAVSHTHTATSANNTAGLTTNGTYKNDNGSTLKTLKGTLYTSRGEYSRWIHALGKDRGNGWDANGVIEVRNGYYDGEEYQDPGFRMQEIQVRPNQWHKPDRLKFDFTHKHAIESHNHTITVDQAGEAGTDKNMPPYLAVYMWKRVK